MIKSKQKQVVTPAESSYKVKKMVIMALIAAMAYVVVILCRLPIIPSVPFLDLEFKSAIILIGSFIFGPMSGFIMSLVICIVELLTISDTGILGCIMNILATVSFVCPAAYVYKKKQSTTGAIVGIVIGAVLMTIAMVLWNYIVTPLYMGVEREVIVSLLIPAFIPFNLLKAGVNGGAALLIFRFVIEALQKTNLIPKAEDTENNKKSGIIGAVIVSCLIIATCVLIILSFNGVF